MLVQYYNAVSSNRHIDFYHNYADSYSGLLLHHFMVDLDGVAVESLQQLSSNRQAMDVVVTAVQTRPRSCRGRLQ